LYSSVEISRTYDGHSKWRNKKKQNEGGAESVCAENKGRHDNKQVFVISTDWIIAELCQREAHYELRSKQLG
jgi:hypothetical protein